MRKISLTVLALLVLSLPASLPARAATDPTLNSGSIRSALRKDIERSRQVSFGTLLRQWEEQYGSRAVSPLLELAALRSLADPQRYTALMGAARLGGTATAPLLSPFLKDSSWMIRAGALRAIAALKNPQTASAPLPLLRDPALVVRLEAVSSIEKLRPAGASDALIQAIQSKENYHAHRAQWIPQRALKALRTLGTKDTAPKLIPLFERVEDPEIRKEVSATLQSLTGKSVPTTLSATEQARRWKTLIGS